MELEHSQYLFVMKNIKCGSFEAYSIGGAEMLNFSRVNGIMVYAYAKKRHLNLMYGNLKVCEDYYVMRVR